VSCGWRYREAAKCSNGAIVGCTQAADNIRAIPTRSPTSEVDSCLGLGSRPNTMRCPTPAGKPRRCWPAARRKLPRRSSTGRRWRSAARRTRGTSRWARLAGRPARAAGCTDLPTLWWFQHPSLAPFSPVHVHTVNAPWLVEGATGEGAESLLKETDTNCAWPYHMSHTLIVYHLACAWSALFIPCTFKRGKLRPSPLGCTADCGQACSLRCAVGVLIAVGGAAGAAGGHGGS
jgi:hypothetical protein